MIKGQYATFRLLILLSTLDLISKHLCPAPLLPLALVLALVFPPFSHLSLPLSFELSFISVFPLIYVKPSMPFYFCLPTSLRKNLNALLFLSSHFFTYSLHCPAFVLPLPVHFHLLFSVFPSFRSSSFHTHSSHWFVICL